MPKTYSPFLEVTRADEVEGLSTISLINVDNINLIQCLADGSAKLYFVEGSSNTPQFMTPVENYAWFVGQLTELTTVADQPIAKPAPRRRKPAKPRK